LAHWTSSLEEVVELTDADIVEQLSVRYGGRYELLSLVGRGAYGSVYRARDTELEETVAVKVLLREHIVRPEALERFRREVRLARRVAHPNVARTFDIGSHKDERFLTMEYIDGHPLTRLTPIGAPLAELLPLRLVIDVAMELCAGLGALHAASIVHCDIKSDNVLIARDGRVVITDFGIARAIKDADHGSDTALGAAMVGTPAYMAPEQVRGHGVVDTRADLYAVGVMLFQLLTGQLPFVGATAMETALQRLCEPPRSPLAVRPELPVRLAEIVLRSLEREPDRRFQTADELAMALSAERPAGPALAKFLQQRTVENKRAVASAMARSLVLEPTVTVNVTSTTDIIAAAQSLPALALPQLHSSHGGSQLAVAVLLFHLPPDSGDEYLAHGLTEEIIDRLSEAEELRLTSFGAVRGLRSDERDPSELGKKLRAQVLVDGSLQFTSGGMRATVRLIEVERGIQLAVRRFERSDRNALALASEVAQAVGRLLTVRLESGQNDLLSDAVAVDLYLRGRHAYNALTPDGAAQSVQLFAQALARLPDEKTLLAEYAVALSRHWFFDGPGAADLAVAAAERAVRIAPDQGASYLAQATVLLNSGRAIETATSLRIAMMLSPHSSEVYELYGYLLSETGPIEVALRHLNYALMMDKSVPRVRLAITRVWALQGQLEIAIDTLLRNGAELAAKPLRYIVLARLLGWLGDRQRVRAVLTTPELAEPGFVGQRRRLEFLAGLRELSLDEYVPIPYTSPSVNPRARMFCMQFAVEYYCIMGQRAEALAVVEQLAADELFDIVWLEHCPLLKLLHGEPGYARACERVTDHARKVRLALGVGLD